MHALLQKEFLCFLKAASLGSQLVSPRVYLCGHQSGKSFPKVHGVVGKFITCQAIQFMTFVSPIVGGRLTSETVT